MAGGKAPATSTDEDEKIATLASLVDRDVDECRSALARADGNVDLAISVIVADAADAPASSSQAASVFSAPPKPQGLASSSFTTQPSEPTPRSGPQGPAMSSSSSSAQRPSVAELAAVPRHARSEAEEDVPAGHEAHTYVRNREGDRAVIIGPLFKRAGHFQVTRGAAGGSIEAAMRIARLCYVRLLGGTPKADVLRWKEQLCEAAKRGPSPKPARAPVPPPTTPSPKRRKVEAAPPPPADAMPAPAKRQRVEAPPAVPSPESPTSLAPSDGADDLIAEAPAQVQAPVNHERVWEDVPAEHVAHKLMRVSEKQGCPYVAFKYKPSEDAADVPFQVTVQKAGTRQHCLRLARLCYQQFERGQTKEQVLQYRRKLYEELEEAGVTKAQEPLPEVAGPTSRPSMGECLLVRDVVGGCEDDDADEERDEEEVAALDTCHHGAAWLPADSPLKPAHQADFIFAAAVNGTSSSLTLSHASARPLINWMHERKCDLCSGTCTKDLHLLRCWARKQSVPRRLHPGIFYAGKDCMQVMLRERQLSPIKLLQRELEKLIVGEQGWDSLLDELIQRCTCPAQIKGLHTTFSRILYGQERRRKDLAAAARHGSSGSAAAAAFTERRPLAVKALDEQLRPRNMRIIMCSSVYTAAARAVGHHRPALFARRAAAMDGQDGDDDEQRLLRLLGRLRCDAEIFEPHADGGEPVARKIPADGGEPVATLQLCKIDGRFASVGAKLGEAGIRALKAQEPALFAPAAAEEEIFLRPVRRRSVAENAQKRAEAAPRRAEAADAAPRLAEAAHAGQGQDVLAAGAPEAASTAGDEQPRAAEAPDPWLAAFGGPSFVACAEAPAAPMSPACTASADSSTEDEPPRASEADGAAAAGQPQVQARLRAETALRRLQSLEALTEAERAARASAEATAEAKPRGLGRASDDLFAALESLRRGRALDADKDAAGTAGSSRPLPAAQQGSAAQAQRGQPARSSRDFHVGGIIEDASAEQPASGASARSSNAMVQPVSEEGFGSSESNSSSDEGEAAAKTVAAVTSRICNLRDALRCMPGSWPAAMTALEKVSVNLHHIRGTEVMDSLRKICADHPHVKKRVVNMIKQWKLNARDENNEPLYFLCKACDKVYDRSKQRSHLSTECPNAVTCGGCNLRMFDYEFAAHERGCGQNSLCPGCSTRHASRAALRQHVEEGCTAAMICPGCRNIVGTSLATSLKEHTQRCKLVGVCPGCPRTLMLKVNLDAHVAGCPRVLQCVGCAVNISKEYASVHWDRCNMVDKCRFCFTRFKKGTDHKKHCQAYERHIADIREKKAAEQQMVAARERIKEEKKEEMQRRQREKAQQRKQEMEEREKEQQQQQQHEEEQAAQRQAQRRALDRQRLQDEQPQQQQPEKRSEQQRQLHEQGQWQLERWHQSDSQWQESWHDEHQWQLEQWEPFDIASFSGSHRRKGRRKRQGAQQAEKSIWVPEDSIAKIIGTGGAVVNDMQSRHNVHIEVTSNQTANGVEVVVEADLAEDYPDVDGAIEEIRCFACGSVVSLPRDSRRKDLEFLIVKKRRSLQSEFGVKITTGGTNSGEACEVRVFGKPDDVSLAQKAIEALLRSEAEKSSQVVAVPTAVIGAIIGRGGAKVRSLQDEYGVQIAKASESGGTCGVQITGKSENVELAKAAVQSLLESLDKTDTFQVPRNTVGAILGVRGAKVKVLESDFSVKIKVSDGETEWISDVQITGKPERIKVARENIESLVQSLAEPPPPPPVEGRQRERQWHRPRAPAPPRRPLAAATTVFEMRCRCTRALVVLAAAVGVGAASAPYPACVEADVVFRHAGAHAIFVDVSYFGSSGCWAGNCKISDKFAARDPGVCARACSHIDECTHWSYGEQEGSARCFLRKSDGGREADTPGFLSGTRLCTPPALPESLVALRVAELPALRACDAGRSASCPDMARAMRTWKFAIESLRRATDGVLDANTLQFVSQIGADVDSFVEEMTEENFPVVIANNLQVFQALRAWLEDQPGGNVDHTDRSLPDPLQGFLCGPSSCFDR